MSFGVNRGMLESCIDVCFNILYSNTIVILKFYGFFFLTWKSPIMLKALYARAVQVRLFIIIKQRYAVAENRLKTCMCFLIKCKYYADLISLTILSKAHKWNLTLQSHAWFLLMNNKEQSWFWLQMSFVPPPLPLYIVSKM